MSALSRRGFLQASGALVVVVAAGQASIAAAPGAAAADLPAVPDPTQLDAWLAILPDGSVQAFFGKIDMGHGLEVAIAQIVAEELDVALASVSLVMGDSARTCNQGGASGSYGVSHGGRPLRNAAAEARRVLLAAAAVQLQVPVTELTVRDGVVSVTAQPARQLSYAQLIGGRSFNTRVEWNKAVGNLMDVKGQATPKSRDQYRLVGQSLQRRDLQGKVFGTLPFITDVKVEGMWHARMIRPPHAGGHVQSIDTASIAAWPQAQVVHQQDMLAVVAPGEWMAVQAARALQVQWSADGTRWPGHDGLHAALRAAPVLRREEPLRRGDVDAAFAGAARIIEAQYEWPLQSHASMGPGCAIADVRDGRATIWTGSQKPHSVRDGAAKLLGLAPEAVRSIWVMAPGSYGRNDAGDVALDAAWLSQRLGKPVRVQYMRHDATAWDPKGPACVHRGRAALDAAGKVLALDFTTRGLSRVDAQFHEADPRDTLAGQALGMPSNADLGLGIPAESYGFAAKRLAWEVVAPLQARYSPLRTSHLRDPLGPEVHFGSEQFIDELAVETGQDPVAFRLQHVTAVRDKAVIEAVAKAAGWQPRSTPRGRKGRDGLLRGRGIAYAQRNETVVAVIAEVTVDPATGRVHVPHVSVAHDCGLVVNPQGLRQTIEGNVLHGLSRVLFEQVQFDSETVHSVDWASYPILEMADAPQHIEIVMIDPTAAAPSGAGEPTIRSVPAAVANAFFDATGKRLRRAPFTPERVKNTLAQQSSKRNTR